MNKYFMAKLTMAELTFFKKLIKGFLSMVKFIRVKQ